MIACFSRFRVLIALLVAGLLLITALAFILFTRAEVTAATRAAGDETARNVLQVVGLNIRSQHRDLETFRAYALAQYEEQLRNLVGVVIAQIDDYRQMAEQGWLTAEQARARALAAVERLRYGHNDYFFIYDSRNIAIAHPDPNIRGHDVSRATDDQGRPVLQTLRAEFQDDGAGTCTLWWLRLGATNPVPKLLYAQHYTNWDWLVGTGIYIDDVDADARRRMDGIMEVLRAAFAEVKVGATGYFFVFDGHTNLLIHPQSAGTVAPALFGDLVRAATNPAVPFKYRWTKPGAPADQRFWKYSHVQYFPPFDWFIASSVYEDEMEAPADRVIRRQAIFAAVLVALCLALALALVTRVTRPLARLTRYADRLQATDFDPPRAETDDLLRIHFPREVGRLAQTLWNLEGRLQEHLANLKATVAARERLQSDLRIAHNIQMSMLPRAGSAPHPAIELAAALEPAKEVGGDLYDFFLIDEERLCLAVGDVSDKGVSAALFMARGIALLRYIVTRERLDPPAALARANRELCAGNDLCMFMTALLGFLDLRTGRLVYSNAGHLPPLRRAGAGGCAPLDLPRGKPLGLVEQAVYTAREAQLAAGDLLLLYSDGVTEAMDPADQAFGDAALVELLAGANGDAAAVVAAIRQAVHAHARGAPQSDDITLLCARWRGETDPTQKGATKHGTV